MAKGETVLNPHSDLEYPLQEEIAEERVGHRVRNWVTFRIVSGHLLWWLDVQEA